MSFSRCLKQFRESANLSQREVARRIGVNESTYRQWEYGTTISGEPYPKFAEAFGITTGGVVDRTIADRGTIWLSPPGPKECLFDISAPVPQVLHIYLPSQHFSADSLGIGADAAAAHTSLRYERSFQDPLVAEIAFAIVLEDADPDRR